MGAVRSCLLAVALMASGIVPAAASAQAADLPAPRQLTVRLTSTGAHAPDSVAAGRYRIQVRAPRRGLGLLVLVKPDRGYTQADLHADARRGPAGNRHIQQSLRFFGGVQTHAGGTGALWETLYAGRYWLLSFSSERPRRFSIETVHVHGTPFASSFPRVSAEVTSLDHALRITRRISATGRMLIRNDTAGTDSLFFIPLRRGATYEEFLRALRRRHADLPIRFRGFRTTLPLAADAGYVLRYRLRPGTYVVVGFSAFNALLHPRNAPLRRLVRPVRVRPGSGASAHAFSASSARPAGFVPVSGRAHGWSAKWPAWVMR
jgi:hypothetical protein